MATTVLPDDPRLALLRGLGRGAASSADVLVLEGELVLARARAAGVVPSLVVAAASVAERLRPSTRARRC
ncbi:MAG: hypothetical protein IPH07_00490 [Deltaproteobacteria bacterium]|nr:hypothetical protein [Deltaproteobacteria bacterium]